MGADSVTFDEGFRARLGVDVGWGLAAELFLVFGGIENTSRLNGCRVTVRM